MLNDAEHQNLQSEVGNQPVMEGTEVFDVNGHKVGKVSDRGLQEDALIVVKGMIFPREVYIPLRAIQARLVDGIHLNISKDDISSQDWDRAPAEPAGPAERVESDDLDDPYAARPTRSPINPATGAEDPMDLSGGAPLMDVRDQLVEPPDTATDPDARH